MAAGATAQTRILESWNGFGSQHTERFHVDGPFELKLSSTGSFVGMLFDLQTNATQRFSSAIDGTGYLDVDTGGDYFIQAFATGSWNLQAIDMSAPVPLAPQPAALAPEASAIEITPPAPANGLAGPSFPCPQPRDPLAQLICSDPGLSRLNLRFVEVYQALRQQVGPAGQAALRQESINFGMAVRSSCGIDLAQSPNSTGTPPASAPASAIPCVNQGYTQQRAAWAGRLQGPAAEEASLQPEQLANLQKHLQVLGYLPATSTADAVFGTGTRSAIVAWQTAKGRPPTGVLGNDDAGALLQDNAVATVAPSAPPQATLSTGAPNASNPPPAPAKPGAPGIPATQTGDGTTDWNTLTSQAASQGLTVSYKSDGKTCVIVTSMDPGTMTKLTAQYISAAAPNSAEQKTWSDHSSTVGLMLFKAAFSAPTVKRFYADFPSADECSFRVAANSYDDFGQPSLKDIFSFSLDRAIYSKINWQHFVPTNLNKVAETFTISPELSDKLKNEGTN